MKKNQIKIGAVLSYIQMALNVIIGITYTPIMIKALGQEEYGLYQTAASIISVLTLLNLGFNSGYIRYFSKYKKNNDNEAIYKLNGLFLLIFLVIGIVALASGLIISNNLQLVFKEGLTVGEYALAKKLMIILTINLAISFPMSVFSNIISANECFVFLKLMGMINTVLGPFVMIPLLFMGYRSVALVVVSLIVSCIVNLTYFIYTVFVLNNRFVFKNLSIHMFADLFKYTAFIALNMLIDQINWNVDKILLGRYKGTVAVSLYSVAFSLHQYYQNFSTAIAGVFTPRIHAICNSKGNISKELTDLFIRVGRLQFSVLLLVISGFILWGNRFICYWVGNDFGISYYVALLLLVPDTIALIQNLGIEIQRALNKHQFRSVVYTVMACINLVLSIFLCQLYGPVGSAVGTAISIVVGPVLIMNIFYYKKCDLDIPCFWKNIMKMTFGIIPPIIISAIFIGKFEQLGIWGMFIEILIYSFIYFVSMWLISLNSYEKEIIKSLLKIRR